MPARSETSSSSDSYFSGVVTPEVAETPPSWSESPRDSFGTFLSAEPVSRVIEEDYEAEDDGPPTPQICQEGFALASGFEISGTGEDTARGDRMRRFRQQMLMDAVRHTQSHVSDEVAAISDALEANLAEVASALDKLDRDFEREMETIKREFTLCLDTVVQRGFVRTQAVPIDLSTVLSPWRFRRMPPSSSTCVTVYKADRPRAVPLPSTGGMLTPAHQYPQFQYQHQQNARPQTKQTETKQAEKVAIHGVCSPCCLGSPSTADSDTQPAAKPPPPPAYSQKLLRRLRRDRKRALGEWVSSSEEEDEVEDAHEHKWDERIVEIFRRHAW